MKKLNGTGVLSPSAKHTGLGFPRCPTASASSGQPLHNLVSWYLTRSPRQPTAPRSEFRTCEPGIDQDTPRAQVPTAAGMSGEWQIPRIASKSAASGGLQGSLSCRHQWPLKTAGRPARARVENKASR